MTYWSVSVIPDAIIPVSSSCAALRISAILYSQGNLSRREGGKPPRFFFSFLFILLLRSLRFDTGTGEGCKKTKKNRNVAYDITKEHRRGILSTDTLVRTQEQREQPFRRGDPHVAFTGATRTREISRGRGGGRIKRHKETGKVAARVPARKVDAGTRKTKQKEKKEEKETLRQRTQSAKEKKAFRDLEKLAQHDKCNANNQLQQQKRERREAASARNRTAAGTASSPSPSLSLIDIFSPLPSHRSGVQANPSFSFFTFPLLLRFSLSCAGVRARAIRGDGKREGQQRMLCTTTYTTNRRALLCNWLMESDVCSRRLRLENLLVWSWS